MQSEMQSEKKSEAKKPQGVGASIDVGTSYEPLSVFIGYDDAVNQWLCAKRQGLEQELARLRHAAGQLAPLAAFEIERAALVICGGGEDEPDVKRVTVELSVWRFAQTMCDLHRVEADLRRLGIEPERAGVTRAARDWFLSEVTAPEDEAEQDEAAA